MRRILAVMALLLAALAVGVPVRAQSSPASMLSRVGGVYFSPAYANWRSVVVQGNSATGAQTIVACPGQVTLNDGRVITPFSTIAPFTIDVGANSETLTPSAVSLVTPPQGASSSSGNCASITATFSNTHTGYSTPIVTGDAGVEEAIYDAGANGGGLVYWEADSGSVTLGTGATTTTLCSSCIPVNALVLGVVARVETTITGTCSGWELGDGTTAGRFTANNTGLTAGTVSAADIQTTSGVASTTTGMLNITSAKSIISTCATGDPSAGALRVKAFGYVLATSLN